MLKVCRAERKQRSAHLQLAQEASLNKHLKRVAVAFWHRQHCLPCIPPASLKTNCFASGQTNAQRRSAEAEASQRAAERNHERALAAVREEAKKQVDVCASNVFQQTTAVPPQFLCLVFLDGCVGWGLKHVELNHAHSSQLRCSHDYKASSVLGILLAETRGRRPLLGESDRTLPKQWHSCSLRAGELYRILFSTRPVQLGQGMLEKFSCPDGYFCDLGHHALVKSDCFGYRPHNFMISPAS